MEDSQGFPFVAEILDKTGEPCGMGILVASDRVLTCAHVVNLALDRSEAELSEPFSDSSVELRFPFYSGGRLRGSVHRWYAPAGKQEVNDCCVLALKSPQGPEVVPARFAEATPGREFQVPRRTGPHSPLKWVYGTIGEACTNGLYQANKQEGAEKDFIAPGCSGAPVIDNESGYVLGMVIWANPQTETAHFAPTQTLERASKLLKPPRSDRRRWLLAAGAGIAATAAGGIAWWMPRKPRLRIGIKPFPGYAPLKVAQQLELCPNVDIEFNPVETVVAMRNQVRAGELDAAPWLSCTHGLFRSDSNPVNAKVVLKLDESKQGDGIIVQPEITSIADLQGKAIATQRSDAGEYLFRRFCETHGIQYESFNVKHVSAVDAKQLFIDKKVQAASTYEPHLDVVRKKLGIEPKWTAQDLGPFGIVDILAVREDYLDNYPDAITALIDGWYAAVDRLQRSDSQAIAIAVGFLKTEDTPDYNAENFKNDIAPGVVELANKKDNRRFFRIIDGRSEFLDHYEKGIEVFRREIFQPFPFNERDIPNKFHR
jgi:NitT/TauT family transport system substrate-binding protein